MRTRRVDSLFVTDAEDVLLGMLSVEAINQNRRKPVTAGEIMSEVSLSAKARSFGTLCKSVS